MRNKLTLLLAVLLLAVGWSSTASAQAYVLKADDMKNWTYKWLPQGATDSVAANYVELNSKTGKYAAPEVTDPYQIYGLLRAVYMDKRLPGHFQSAYTSTGTRENPTYYGGIGGGWNIPFGATSSTVVTTYDDIVFQVGANYSSRVKDACVSKIEVIADGVTVSTITASNISSLPEGWTKSGTWTLWTNSSNNTTYFYTTSSTSSLTYNGDLLKNKSSVEVKVTAYDYNYSDAQYYAYYYGYDYYAYIYVNGASGQLTGSDVTYTATIEGTTTGTNTTTPTDVLITTLLTNTLLQSITITDANDNLITRWRASYDGATLPDGWYANTNLVRYSNSYYYMNGPARNSGGTIRIDASKFAGYNTIKVQVVANSSSSSSYAYVKVCDDDNYVNFSSLQTITRTINFPAVVATDTYKPEHEGYTALMVSVKNNGQPYMVNNSIYKGSFELGYDQLMDYIKNNIKSVKLLTDGMRIGAGEEVGTVFNCDGTYNKFFFLGKGQARKKSSGTLSTIGNTSADWPSYTCEQGPFKFMYEEFSPTSGDSAAQITDFYIEMMDGAVYPIVHDCASVIQNGHQFSMSGNKGTQQYAMSGMNFFIPDYRLKYWLDETYTIHYTDNVDEGPYSVDGRDMNPYRLGDANNKLGAAFSQASDFAVNYAQYNPQHPPRVGLYLLTLDAEAFPCEGYDVETNPNYTVTLDWTSSLNEMSGGDVPQKYVIYEVTYDENGNEVLDSIDIVTNETFYDFKGKKWPQHDYSETHTYIIKGWPTDSDHPSFIAWSNQDNIIIPGLKDFLALALDHYESDFDVPKMQNWYRNFLNVKNENDANGLTTDRIHEGYNVFNLMRYEDRDSTITTQVAQIVFENMPDGTVKYTINYVDENGTPTQDIEAAKYELSAMNIPTTGTLTVVADGDIIIQPNGYDVNFLKIQVQAGNYNKTWTASDNSLPAGWSVSNGSQWLKEDGAYYLEGNGYILIPASTIGNYTTATVTINAFGDTGKTAKIKVNGESTAILNGEENAKDYIWTIGGSSKAPASPKRIIPSRKDDSRNKVNTNNN